MHDIAFWIAFFGAPLFLLLITAYVFRPSARERYGEAQRVIFADEQANNPQRGSLARTANGQRDDVEPTDAR